MATPSSHGAAPLSVLESSPAATNRDADPLAAATAAVLVKSEKPPDGTPVVMGHDFNADMAAGRVNYDALLQSYATVGFQATHFGQAVDRVKDMLKWRPSAEAIASGSVTASARCTIFLGFTSNLVSSGVREVIRFLVQHKLVDVLVSTAGGVEEDLIKCLAPTVVGEFRLDGKALRARGLNRIGNLLVPNDNYCKFEDWVFPILTAMRKEQADGATWTPSKMIARLGAETGDESSICYWAAKNNIPIYCPALTDGSLGDMIFFHSYKEPGLVIDLVADIRSINSTAIKAAATGIIVLGGGVVKHHVSNANLMRNGADYAVYINTGQEFDGSDSGATPDEAVSWGKIKSTAAPVKVCGEATLIFPLLVAQTFAKEQLQRAAEGEVNKTPAAPAKTEES
ncbi:hypothetical protein MMPV_007785 [Pyropia vietnamensis]